MYPQEKGQTGALSARVQSLDSHSKLGCKTHLFTIIFRENNVPHSQLVCSVKNADSVSSSAHGSDNSKYPEKRWKSLVFGPI